MATISPLGSQASDTSPVDPTGWTEPVAVSRTSIWLWRSAELGLFPHPGQSEKRICPPDGENTAAPYPRALGRAQLCELIPSAPVTSSVAFPPPCWKQAYSPLGATALTGQLSELLTRVRAPVSGLTRKTSTRELRKEPAPAGTWPSTRYPRAHPSSW